MTILIILLIYLLGCILCLGRLTASFYEVEEDYMPDIPCEYNTIWECKEVVLLSITSWIGLISGILLYFFNSEKYFFKWSYKSLKK